MGHAINKVSELKRKEILSPHLFDIKVYLKVHSIYS